MTDRSTQPGAEPAEDDQEQPFLVPGRAMSPRVARQLAARRGWRNAWKRDPSRELSLLLLGLFALWAAFSVGVTLKRAHFEATGADANDTYWMESAQRYRYVRMVAENEGIPQIDTRMQAPDGYPPRSDTVLQEMIYGGIHQRLGSDAEPLAPFVRKLTRILSGSAVLPVALLAWALVRRRDAALLAALAWAVALPVAERGTGMVLFREDLAVPVLAWHLALLALWARSLRWGWALGAGALLALALLLWKVTGFYLLMLVVFLGSAHWLRRAAANDLLRGTILILLPPLLASGLPLNLRWEGFWFSTPFLAGVSVAVAMFAGWRKPHVAAWKWAFVSGALFAGARLALPSEAGFDHAWATIAARVQHLGHKPADPGLLGFHARHYWTGNYESPTLARMARDFPWLALAALPGLLLTLRWWQPATWRDVEPEPRPRRPPIRLWEGLGPAEHPGGLASHLLLWLLVSLVGSYLLFRKLQLFAALALVVLVAVGLAGPRRARRLVRAFVLLACVLVGAHGFGWVPNIDQLVTPSPGPDAWNPVSVHPPAAFNDVARALPTLSELDDTVLASFVVSPFILAYTDRPTVLHCFFEGDVLERYRAITEARFGTEQQLWQVARGFGARWYLHEAHHLLRTDPRMSQRYVADQLDWPAHSALAAMSYAPEQLRHFELVWENAWFRLFRVLDDGEVARKPGRGVPTPTWSRRLFTHLWGDPLGDDVAPDVAAERLLYATLLGERRIASAKTLLESDDVDWAERELQEALRVAPYLWEAHKLLAGVYEARGDSTRAARHRAQMGKVQRGLSGEGPLPDGLQPAPIHLVGLD